MSSNDTRAYVTCDDDDIPPPGYNATQTPAEVKPKPVCPSFHIFLLIIGGTLCILLGTIDLIVFTVIPYNKINSNKKNYPNCEFKKPDYGIVTLHVLQHITLIAIGAILISGVNPKFFESFYFTLMLFLLALIFGSLYFILALYSGLVINYVKKENFELSQLINHINFSHPIDFLFYYIAGYRSGYKSKYKKCYSKNGFSLPVQSNSDSQLFTSDEKIPDFFYLEISQKVDMSDKIIEWAAKAREKISLCHIQFNVAIDYYPLFEGKNLILSDGKKIPSYMKKPSAIASVLFGLGVYPELLEKSIPIKKIDMNTFLDAVEGVDYESLYTSINCINIGQCSTSNDRPHM